MEKYLRFVYFIFFITIFFTQPSLAASLNKEAQLNDMTAFYIDKIIANTSPRDGMAGSIVAAKSKKNPNYHYHWVRDAALVAESLLTVYDFTDVSHQNVIKKLFWDYCNFSTYIQNISAVNLGEPKFHVNGGIFSDAWGRPQNDGPALRAISLIHFANLLFQEGKQKLIEEKLYRSEIPATSPIKKDLEYISHHWQEPSYDLWEEVKGLHFYTLMVQRRALVEGAALAKKLGDSEAASWYLAQSRLIQAYLEKFYDATLGIFVPTINYVEGINYKQSQLDTSVILALLHGGLDDGVLAWDDPRVIKTIEKLESVFADLYPINKVKEIPGVAIGRYPEDRYAGTHFNEGNPWVLCTLAFAETYYKLSEVYISKGDSAKAQKAIAKANQFLERVKYHAHKDGSLDEQMNRHTGYMTSAKDLTWNYAAMLTTNQAMKRISRI